jgi:hypothetical protein
MQVRETVHKVPEDPVVHLDLASNHSEQTGDTVYFFLNKST